MLIKWEEVVRLCPQITGIIHVGAYRAEEAKYYGEIPCKWVEADPELYDDLKVKDKYWFAATNFTGSIAFNVMKFRPANSILWPNLNAKRRSDVRVIDTIEVPAREIREIQEPGYHRVKTEWTKHGWGDALYVRYD